MTISSINDTGSAPSISDRLKHRGVPNRYLDAAWDTFDFGGLDAKLAERVGQFRAWQGTGAESIATLSGRVGTGKTHLAVATMRRWYEAGRFDARFVSMSRLLYELRSGIASGAADVLMERVLSASLLVLDDLGKQRATDWALDTIQLVIGERYDNMRPTVITTNLTLDEINSEIDGRIASRLASGFLLRLDLPDFRISMKGRP